MTAMAFVPQQPLQRRGMADEEDPSSSNQRFVSNGSNNNGNNNNNFQPQQPPQQQQSPRASILMLSQWIDTCAAGLFSTCENGGQASWATSVRNEPLHSLDYSQLHDHFLESLLQEAANPPSNSNPQAASEKKKSSTADAVYRNPPGSIPDDSDSSVLSSNQQQPSRRRRLPRLARNKQQQPHNGTTSTGNESGGNLSADSDADSSNKLSKPAQLQRQLSKLPPGQPYDPNDPMPLLPHHFLHDHARMQKDKGRGEEPGSLICAKGQDACLEKLRAKMQLLCNTAIQEKGASMKRRPARVSVHLDNFVETRSILEVRLGFLSMMYGILLRWDTNITGKITLVVLRKMCHESFYPAAPAVVPHLSASTSGSSAEEDAEDLNGEGGEAVNNNNYLKKKRSSPRVVEGKAIVDWPDGTEVTILEPPYLIPRPDKFKPTVMAVSSLYATGLDRKTSWMVQFELQNVPEVTSLNLTYDSTRKHFVPRVHGASSSSPWKGIKYEVESLDAILDVKLYQVKVRNRKKLIGTMQVPLANLPVQKDPPTHLSIPCQEATLDLDIYLESESLEWTQNELEARRKASSFFWPRSSARSPRLSLMGGSPNRSAYHKSMRSSLHPTTPPPPMIGVVDTDDEEDDDDAWGWILCHMC